MTVHLQFLCTACKGPPATSLQQDKPLVYGSLSCSWDCQLLTLMISKTGSKLFGCSLHILQFRSYSVSVLNSALPEIVVVTAAERSALDMHFQMHSLVSQGLSCGLIC